MPFSKLGLMADLQRAVSAQGDVCRTPIQAQGSPAVVEGRDVLAGAQAGTGETAAFTLPMWQMLTGRAGRTAMMARPAALSTTSKRIRQQWQITTAFCVLTPRWCISLSQHTD